MDIVCVCLCVCVWLDSQERLLTYAVCQPVPSYVLCCPLISCVLTALLIRTAPPQEGEVVPLKEEVERLFSSFYRVHNQ